MKSAVAGERRSREVVDSTAAPSPETWRQLRRQDPRASVKSPPNGPVAQMRARVNGIHEVTGSIQVWSTRPSFPVSIGPRVLRTRGCLLRRVHRAGVSDARRLVVPVKLGSRASDNSTLLRARPPAKTDSCLGLARRFSTEHRRAAQTWRRLRTQPFPRCGRNGRDQAPR